MVSNWGRWGQDDQRGMQNLLTPAHILKAAQLVRHGRAYNLAVDLGTGERIYPGFHETWRVTYWGNQSRRTGGADDILVLVSHAGTHVDALSHAWRDGKLWNGRPLELVNPKDGTPWADVRQVGTIVTRGVLADVASFKGVGHLMPDDGITPDDLDRCLEREGVQLEPGNVLLVRTGWHGVHTRDRALWESGAPGLHEATADWLNAHGVVAVGADTPGVEWIPRYGEPLPLHPRLLCDLGILIIENLQLEEIAHDRAFEFVFAAAPLPLVGGTGAPAVPIAIT